jgi:hypothetical protein
VIRPAGGSRTIANNGVKVYTVLSTADRGLRL